MYSKREAVVNLLELKYHGVEKKYFLLKCSAVETNYILYMYRFMVSPPTFTTL